MQRVYNELTADEVNRKGGIKVGDFGTGGRTYKYNSREENDNTSSSSSSKSINGTSIFLLLTLISFGALFYTERNLFKRRRD